MRLTSRKQRPVGRKDWPQDRKVVLHVGCGPRSALPLPSSFGREEWHEVRLDINPDVDPDVVANIVDMPVVESESVDAVWSSNNLEHVFAHEVPLALSEFHRVLRPGGAVYVQVPDLTLPMKAVARGRLEDPIYTSAAGPISALDMIFGFGRAIERGEHHMAHRTAFTEQTLRRKFVRAQFVDIRVVPRAEALWASARRSPHQT